MSGFVYYPTLYTVKGILKMLYRFRVSGREKIPKSGGLIIAANHISYFDPPVMAAALPRRLTFLAKQELFRFAPFGRYISALGAFPIDRSRGDTGAIRQAVKLLNEGKVLLIFPEGGRNLDGNAEVKSGVAFLARMTGGADCARCNRGYERCEAAASGSRCFRRSDSVQSRVPERT